MTALLVAACGNDDDSRGDDDHTSSPETSSGAQGDDLEAVMLDEPLPGFAEANHQLNGPTTLHGAPPSDAPVDVQAEFDAIATNFEQGFVRSFENDAGDEVLLAIYQFTDVTSADRYAEHVFSLSTTGPGSTDQEEASVPRHPEALAVTLDTADMSGAFAVVATGELVLEVRVTVAPGEDRLAQVADVLDAQLAQL